MNQYVGANTKPRVVTITNYVTLQEVSYTPTDIHFGSITREGHRRGRWRWYYAGNLESERLYNNYGQALKYIEYNKDGTRRELALLISSGKKVGKLLVRRQKDNTLTEQLGFKKESDWVYE